MGPKPKPQPRASTPTITTDRRKCQASNADQRPVKRTRQQANEEQEQKQEEQDDQQLDQYAEIEEAVTKTRGRGGNRGQAKKAPAPQVPAPHKYVFDKLILINIVHCLLQEHHQGTK